MLNSGEIQTFLELIKSLNESLRTLATKVELMERTASFTASSYNELQKEMALVAMRTENFRDFAVNKIGDFASINISEMNKLGGKLDNMDRSLTDLHGTSRHLDDHLDSGESVSADIKSKVSKACEAVSGLAAEVGEIKDAVKPLSELVVAVKKPIAIVIIIYVLVSSMIGVGQMAGTLAGWFGSKVGTPQTTYQTPPSQTTPSQAVPQASKVSPVIH